jgi:GT2 family glycosyltransferase
MQSVFVSIIDFNGRENTIDCLKSVSESSKDNFELNIIVINNFPQKKLNLPSFPNLRVKIIENEKNLGFAGGQNVGIKYALENGADFVFILNNDTTIDKNLIPRLVKAANSGIGIAAPKIYFAKGFEYHKNRYKKEDLGKVFWFAGGKMDWENVIGHHRGVDDVDHGQYEKEEEIDFASGCAMLVSRKVFEKTGLFDKKYFLYYEDNDLSQRTRKSGFKVAYIPKAFMWHKNAGSAGGSGSSLQDYYITRNRMLFGMKFAPLRSKLALIRESLSLLFAGRPWQKKGIGDFYLGKFGKGSYG